MKTFQRVGALVLAMAMLLPFGAEFASAEWNSTVGYYGSVTMEMLEEKLVHENKQVDVHFLEIAYDDDMGAYRLRYMDTGAWYLNTEGTFPYVLAAGDVPAEDIAVSNVHANKWLGLTERSKEVETVTQDALATAVIELNDAGTECSLVKGYYNEILYYFICTPDYKYYCNSKGEMFVAPAEASATNLNRPYVDDDGNPLDIDKILDLENNTLNLPGSNGLSLELSIGNLSYDDGDKSYTVNAYTTINEGDQYYYTYYTYNIQYNITNTYITYIGSNDAYEREEYELYYQLPDGRSSADLTAEEVAGMSFEFYDIVNYARSTDDVSVRALYHFDGNLDDASYFTGQHSGFYWHDGASITYMDAGQAFGGALYLDDNAHTFDVYSASALGSGDFTIQFRHYQASEIDTQDNVENSISLGDLTILSWDEQNLYFDGSAVAELPIGTWHEIAIIRSGDIIYAYLNGICIASRAGTRSFPSAVSFVLGNTSRAYTMLDELRILNIAAVHGGSPYTPTVVPHDSNLVLVLPDSERPIADSYHVIHGDEDAVASWDFTKVMAGDAIPAGLVGCPPTNWNFIGTGGWVYDNTGQYGVLSTIDGGISFKSVVDAYDWSSLMLRANGFLSTNTTYTATIVYSDYSTSSYTFTTPNSISISKSFNYRNELSSAPLASGTISLGWSRIRQNYNDLTLEINPGPGKSIDISYIEITPGSSSNLYIEEVTCVYPSEELQPNTAAIQTAIPVNGYTVGGIRPSMPNRGDCWFPVMGNRISSVQIYTGTHWEEVNARWWTGSRWIPIYAFDINTLEDLFDIADGDTVVPLLPDTNSFFRWWQLQWLDFRQWLESVLGSGGGSGSDCQHVYSSEVTRDPGCVEPGITTFTCSGCGHQYTQLIDAHGHDWIITDTVPDVLDEAGTVIEEGYDILTCSICDATAKDYGDGPEEDDLFDALGDLLAGGVEWLLDKLTQLADKLRLITETFTSYVDKIKGMGGEFPAFFAAAFLLIPEELRILFWTAVVGFVVLVVWKKHSS